MRPVCFDGMREREKEKGRSRVLELQFSIPSRLWAAGVGVWREDCVKSEEEYSKL